MIDNILQGSHAPGAEIDLEDEPGLGPLGRGVNRLLRRYGAVRATIVLTLSITAASAAICYGSYLLLDPAVFENPFGVVLPVLTPLLVAPWLLYEGMTTRRTLYDNRVKFAEQSRALRRSVAEKDRILSVIGHDLRGQLNIVMGFAELIGRRSGTAPLETIRDYAEQIAKAGGATNSILTDLLEWGRLKAGSTALDAGTLDLAEIADHTIDLLRPLAAAKDVVLEREGVQTIIDGDARLIETVLRNAIGNSIKFSRRGSSVRIKVEQRRGEAVLSVADDGIGMDAAQIERLRGAEIGRSSPGTEGEQGTGLGLAICREIVDRHRGRLEIESTVGKGTRVIMVLPVEQDDLAIPPHRLAAE